MKQKDYILAFLVGFVFSSIFFFSDWISVEIGEIAVRLSEMLFPFLHGLTPVAISVLLLSLLPSAAVDLLIIRRAHTNRKQLPTLLLYNALGCLGSFIAFFIFSSVAISMFSIG